MIDNESDLIGVAKQLKPYLSSAIIVFKKSSLLLKSHNFMYL